MVTTVFFADILGFSNASRDPGAPDAIDALSDVANIFSHQHQVARYLQPSIWQGRYGLSDSIFLLADDAERACAAAVEVFFNLAFYNSGSGNPVLMRGAITRGEVREIGPLFPETATGNLVGEAIVRAVELEKCGAKGPRLLVSEEVVTALANTTLSDWRLDCSPGDPSELLWLLPPDPSQVSELMIGDVCRSAADGLIQHAQDPQAVDHYVAYVDLVTRSLLRLRQRNPTAAATVMDQAQLQRARSNVQLLLTKKAVREVEILKRLDDLLGGSP
jgi:hypothetical protein